LLISKPIIRSIAEMLGSPEAVGDAKPVRNGRSTAKTLTGA
jgi:hypothetical protein